MNLLQKIRQFILESYFLDHFPSLKNVLFSNKKLLAYYGFLGDQNFGDELVYQSTKRLFSSFLLIPIKRRMPIVLRLMINLGIVRFSGTVLGGGTLIGESCTHIKVMPSTESPIFLHGTGVREHLTKEWHELLVPLLYGGIRGEISKTRLRDIEIDADIVGDAAFYFAGENNGSQLKKGDVVLINMGTHADCAKLQKTRQELQSFIATMLHRNVCVEFLPFHSIDVSLGFELKQRFPEIFLHKVPSTFQATADIFNRADFAVGERLHFVVMALICECPCYSVNYDTKHNDLLESLEAESIGFEPDRFTASALVEMFDKKQDFNWLSINKRMSEHKLTQANQADKFIESIS